VTKAFGDVLAVDHVDLEVRRGEFFSLLGPSGCGKTTTLRIIGGFEAPTSGTVELDGEDVTWLPPHRRNVNTVFQSYALFPHLDVFENVAFGLRRKRVAAAEVRRRVDDALKLVQLPGLGGRRPGQLSGGQAQRVALARALVNRPAVLLLDEPLGALDLKLRRQMQLELKGIQQEVGITFIYVTHDQEEAMTMSDRIAVMNGGRHEQLADPEELYERPKTRFVAGFLGVSNLLAGTLEGVADGQAAIRLAGGMVVHAPADGIPSAGPIEIGVRPEKIRIVAPAATPDGANALEGTVVDTSYLGVSTQYLVRLGSGESVTVYEQNQTRTARSSLHGAGEVVALTWAPEHTFVVPGGEDSG
jgi:spermidine/putrescine transport system ATP-binding protein